MIKGIGKMSALFATAAIAACGGSAKPVGPSTGAVDLNLAIPDGRTVDAIDLHIVCPTSFVDQHHILNVVNGNVVAAFGGLAPGACTAAMTSRTSDGYDCAGTAAFTIVAGTKVPVPVSVICQGTNASPSGSAGIVARFQQNACATDRIQKVFAIPSNVLTGASTLAEMEINTAAVVGTARYSWATRNNATHTGQGTLSVGTCAATSASCQTFTCTGLGAAPSVDPSTGLPSAGVFLSVTVEDDECFDTEEVWVDCIQSSICGNGIREGSEACDDTNTASNDGCSATCVVESCGDGIIQTSEQCDGLLGVGPNQGCHTVTCQLINNPICGDNVVNQVSENCDGTATPAGETCSATCRINPRCGDGVVNQASEQCDTSGASATCSATCQTIIVQSPCDTCIAGIPDVGAFNDAVCKTDPLCNAARQCVQDNASCWTAIAPAACYCGDVQSQIDVCEDPATVPAGRCATAFRAAAGAGASNAQVLGRYFDPGFPIGSATIIMDSAFSSCRTQCFP